MVIIGVQRNIIVFCLEQMDSGAGTSATTWPGTFGPYQSETAGWVLDIDPGFIRVHDGASTSAGNSVRCVKGTKQ